MNVLSLYKFVNSNNLEYHWHEGDVILFIPNWLLDEWNELLGRGITDEEGITCYMKDRYFCFQMKQICDYFGIWELKDVFDKEEQ